MYEATYIRVYMCIRKYTYTYVCMCVYIYMSKDIWICSLNKKALIIILSYHSQHHYMSITAIHSALGFATIK